MSFNRFVLFIVAVTFLLFSTGVLARQGDEKTAAPPPVKKVEKKNEKNGKKNGKVADAEKKADDKDSQEVPQGIIKEDAFEDDDAFAEKEAVEAAERAAEIQAAVEAARTEALTTCPKCERQREGLQLSQRTMTLGGTITASFDGDIPKDDDQTPMTGGNLTIWPEAGIFLIDQLELFLGIGFSVMLGEIRDSELAKWQIDLWDSFGFDLGIKYIFDTGTIIYPYLGARIGMDIRFAPEPPDEIQTWENLKFFVLGAPIGILIGLSKQVALDVGLQFEFDVSLNKSEDTQEVYRQKIGHQLHLPFGYLGIQAFIPTK